MFRWLLSGALAAVLLHVVGRGLLASAIAHAPNQPLSVVPGDDPPPPELARYAALHGVRVEVGPPRAALSAWVLEPPDGRRARGTIVVLHGVRLDKRSMMPVATLLADAGYRSVLVDLRGHGHSSGAYLTYGVVESRDGMQLLDALESRGIELGPVGLHGFSYGGATAIHWAARDPRVRAVVAVAAFSSLRDVTRDYLRRYAPAIDPAVPRDWLDGAVDLGGRLAAFDPDAAAPARAAERLGAALLVLHGVDDPQVPPYHARALAHAAAGRAEVELRLLAGETHASVLADSRGAVKTAALRWFRDKL